MVVHHGDANVAAAGIRAVGLVAREITPRHDAQPGFPPEPQRRGFIAALRRDVEPQKESARRPPVAVAGADDLIGEIEFLRVEPPVLRHVGLVAIGGDRHPLRRQRHLRRRDVPQLEEAREKPAVAGGKADAQPRQVRALGQRLELDHVREVATGGLEHAGRRLPGIDLGVAFIAEHQEPEPSCELDDAREIGAIRHRALRVRGRGDEEGDCSGEERVGKRVEVGQEAGCGRGGQVDRLAIGRHRAGGIGGVERIGNQHSRAAASAGDPARSRHGGEKQPLARAVEHEDFTAGINRARQRKAAAEP